MGYMTVAVFLNDAWDEIEKNPQKVIENIKKGMFCHPYNEMTGSDRNQIEMTAFPVGNHCNPMEVCASFHADDRHLLLVGENRTVNVAYPLMDKRTDCVDSFIRNQEKAMQILTDRKQELLDFVATQVHAEVLKEYPNLSKEDLTKQEFKDRLKHHILTNEYVVKHPKYFDFGSVKSTTLKRIKYHL